MRSTIIRPVVLAIAALAITSPSLQAQQHDNRQQGCSEQHDRNCNPRGNDRDDGRADQRHDSHQRDHRDANNRRHDNGKHNGPKVGDNGQRGRPYHPNDHKRFPEPPHGKEYRIIDDNVVLVDKDTLKIVAVLGLLAALTN